VTTMLHGHVVKNGNSFGRVDEARQRNVACRVLGDEPPRPPYRVSALSVLTNGLLQAVINKASRCVGIGEGLSKESVSGVALVGRVVEQATRAAVQCIVVRPWRPHSVVNIQH